MIFKALGLVFIIKIVATLNYIIFLISESYDTHLERKEIIVFTIHGEHNRRIFLIVYYKNQRQYFGLSPHTIYSNIKHYGFYFYAILWTL